MPARHPHLPPALKAPKGLGDTTYEARGVDRGYFHRVRDAKGESISLQHQRTLTALSLCPGRGRGLNSLRFKEETATTGALALFWGRSSLVESRCGIPQAAGLL